MGAERKKRIAMAQRELQKQQQEAVVYEEAKSGS